MNDVNLLRHNDEVWRHHFIIFVKVVNGATHPLICNTRANITTFGNIVKG